MHAPAIWNHLGQRIDIRTHVFPQRQIAKRGASYLELTQHLGVRDRVIFACVGLRADVVFIALGLSSDAGAHRRADSAFTADLDQPF